jgi:hypothetical protein
LPGGNGESLGGCHEAEAFARRTVHPGLDLMELGRGEGRDVELARQEAPQATVGVLDTALLPGCMGIAEPGDDAMLAGEMIIGKELGAAVESDALARLGRQAGERLTDRPDDAVRAPVGVADQTDEAALALDQRGQVGPAVRLAKDEEIALPMADLLTGSNVGGPTGNASLRRDLAAPGLAAEAPPADAPGTQQVTVELEGAALGSMDELVDRLVAQAPIIGMAQPAGDLLRRPAECKLGQNLLTQAAIPDQLALPLPPAPGAVMRRYRVLAAVQLDLAELVAADLAIDRRAMAPKLLSDPANADLGLHQPEYRSSILERQLPISLMHSASPALTI